MKAALSIANPVNEIRSANLALFATDILLRDAAITDLVSVDRRQLSDLVNKALDERHGRSVDRIRKSATLPMLSSDSDLSGLSASNNLLNSFAPLLRNSSAFFKLMDGMLLRVPFNSQLTFLTGSIAPTYVNESGAKGVTRLASDTVTVVPVKAGGICAFSKEMLQFLPQSGGSAFLSTELRRALSVTVDSAFFELIGSGSPTNASSGITADAAQADLRWLLRSVDLTSESRPLFVMSPDVGISAASLLSDPGQVFPDMSPTGGSMLNVPAIVSDGLEAGTLGLIDGSGIAGDSLGIELRSATHASLQLNDEPDSPSSASTQLVSLWQSDLVGILAEVFFGATKLRSNAYATITDCEWGSGSDSPP